MQSFSVRVLCCLFILGGASVATAMTDDEAHLQLQASCEFRRAAVNQAVVTKILSLGGVQQTPLAIGSCDDFTSYEGKKAVALNLPVQFTTTAFFDGDRTVPTTLSFTAGADNWNRLVRLSFGFWWQKTPVYDRLGNLDGYNYRFSDNDLSSDGHYGSFEHSFYWIENAATGVAVGTVGVR